MPSLHSETIGSISVYIDCSGSVSQKDIDKYLAEIQAIKLTLNPKKLELIAFDNQVHDVTTITENEPIEFNLTGLGGTDLREVADRINSTQSDINLIFTDGYYKPVNYDVEVLHVIVNNNDYVNNQNNPVIHMDTL
jgi:predicted metal-dependent peptidase